MPRPRVRHILPTIVIITIAAAAITGWVYEDLFATTVMFAAATLGVFTWVRITDHVIQAIAFAMIALSAMGWGIDLYARIWWYDDVLHLVMSVGGAMLVGRILFRNVQVASSAMLWLLVWFCWLGIGSLWEIGEWIADNLMDTNHSRGYFDTMMDMILNSIGGAAGAVMHVRWPGRATTLTKTEKPLVSEPSPVRN